MGDALKSNVFNKWLILIFVLFLVLSENPLNTIGSLYVPLQRVTVVTILLMVMFIITLFRRKILVDMPVLMLLLLRIPYYILNSLLDGATRTTFQAHYLIVLIGPIVFFCIYGMVENYIHIILKLLLKISIIIVAIQVHTSLLFLFFQGHALYQIKLSIGIPLGYSNTIASIALIQIFLAYVLLEKKIYFLISITSLLCTLSKSAFLVFGVIFLIVLFVDSIRKKKLGIFIRYTLLIILILYFANHFFGEYFSVYTKTIQLLLDNDLVSINNGRTRIFYGYLKDISQKPLLGWGLGKYNLVNGMGHNFLLQSLFAGGIVGTILYYMPVILIIRNSLRWENKQMQMALLLLVIVCMGHGIFENVFFTIPCEFLFWIYLSLIYKEGSVNEQNSMYYS